MPKRHYKDLKEVRDHRDELVREIHPDALAIVPLGRACLAVLPQTKTDAQQQRVILRFYHDPRWMAEELTKENLKKHSAELSVYGSRAFLKAYYESAACGDGGVWFENEPHYEICQVCRGTGNGNWRIPDWKSGRNFREEFGEDETKWPYEVFIYICQHCWGEGKVPWRPDWDNEGVLRRAIEKAQLSPEDLKKVDEQEWEEARQRTDEWLEERRRQRRNDEL